MGREKINQTNWRLRQETIDLLEMVATQTNRTKTEVAEYAILKLSAQFKELSVEAKAALVDLISRDLLKVPENLVGGLTKPDPEAVANRLLKESEAVLRRRSRRKSPPPASEKQ